MRKWRVIGEKLIGAHPALTIDLTVSAHSEEEALQRAAASPMGEALAGMDHLFAYEVATGTGGSDARDC